MSKPSFAQTAHAPFAQDNGDPQSVVATIVCPYCKHINTIHYQLETDEILATAKCPHLNHFETVTGHNAIVEFFKNEETEGPPLVYALIRKDHVNGLKYVGKWIELPHKNTLNLKKRWFKLYDDDEVLYYEGSYFEDEYCDNQQAILDWAMYDSGCTMITVADQQDGIYKVEIS